MMAQKELGCQYEPRNAGGGKQATGGCTEPFPSRTKVPHFQWSREWQQVSGKQDTYYELPRSQSFATETSKWNLTVMLFG